MNDGEREIVERALDRQVAWIESANARTGGVIALATAMLAALAVLSPDRGAAWTCFQLLFSAVAAAGLASSLLFCALALLPRTEGPPDSLIFFGHIARRSADRFAADIRARQPVDYESDLLAQVHANANIAALKFRWIQRAMMAFFVSILPWLLALYVFYRR